MDAERAHLVAGVGALVRQERVAGGWRMARLALATGVARQTVWRLENGRRRPSRALLVGLAGAFRADDPRPLAHRFVEAAGASLVENTPGGWRRRQRRQDAALLAGWRPLPSNLATRLAAHRAASAAWRELLALLAPENFDDPAALAAVRALMDQAHELMEVAGDPVRLVVGNHVIRAAWWDNWQ